MTMHQLRRGGSLNSSSTAREREEELDLFREMQKRERRLSTDSSWEGEGDAPAGSASKSVSSSVSLMVPSTPGRSIGVDDIFTADLDKSDYDWLMTPPGTPPIRTLDQVFPIARFSLNDCSSVRSAASLKTPRLDISQADLSSRSESLGSVVRGNPESSTVRSVSSCNLPAARRALSTRSYSVSRSTSSLPSSNPVGRPSSPCARVVSPRLSPASTGSSVRPSTPPGRVTLPASKRPTSSSAKSSTLAIRPSTSNASPTTPRIALTRSSSTGSASMLSSKSAASSRTSSPITKNPALQLPEFSQEPPPNLRTSLPERRGGSAGSRVGGSTTARSSQADANDLDRRNRPASAPTLLKNLLAEEPDGISGNSCQSSSPPVLSNRLWSNTQNGDIGNGKLHDGAGSIPVSSTTVSQTMEKQSRSRKAALSSHEEKSFMNSDVKRNMKSSPTIRSTKSTSSSAQESAGFCKNFSKKSLDMALRQMDIRRNTSSGFRSFMANVPASSLFSVKSRHGRGRSKGTAADSPMATSSTASSEHSMAIVPDPEGSDFGDEAISEKGRKSASASRPDSVSSLSKEKTISMWLEYPDSKDDGEEMQIFKQGFENLTGSESPLVSQLGGIADCDYFALDMT